MSRRLKLCTILFAWFLATGAQWEIVQTFGWGRMFLSYSATMSFAQALKKTFGNDVCGICKAVDWAKQQESSPASNTEIAKAKVVLVCHTHPVFALLLPKSQRLPSLDDTPLGALRSAPPTPPPRAA